MPQVWVLVRRQSLGRFERLAAEWGERAKPLVGELPELALTDETIAELAAQHRSRLVHCAAIYDITAGEAEQRAANVEGTRAVIELAQRLDATLHHVSSIAVAGDFAGEYTEDDFDVGQQLPTPYHQTKFEAELLVRSAPGLRYRIYRPAVVVGDSRTGEMDKVDGPYYFFGVLAKLAVLPSLTPILLPDTGRTNIVPVDYVVDALVALMHAEGRGRARHSTSPHRKPSACAASTAASPRRPGCRRLRGSLPRSVAAPVLKVRGRAKVLRNMAATQLGIPAEVFDVVDLAPTFVSDETRKALRGTGIDVPEFATYAPKLWRYWAEHLDPDRARRDDRSRTAAWAGTSSSPAHPAASAGRRRSPSRSGVRRCSRWPATPTRSTNWSPRSAPTAVRRTRSPATSPIPTSVEHTIKDILGRFDHVDYLVNNAGRSIRRSVVNSTERLHDYERVMAVNYFGAVRMVLALLPHWRERRFGHVVNVSSAGVQARNPKYSSYLPTKAALDAFADVVASETLSDHITFTNIHMPLVRTPMIAPSHRLNPVPAISPERAAAMVVRGLVEKPARIDTPMGTLAEVGNYFTPRTVAANSASALPGLSRFGCGTRTACRPGRGSASHDVSRSVRSGPSRAVSGHPDRSSGWCDWCPECTGKPPVSLPR